MATVLQKTSTITRSTIIRPRGWKSVQWGRWISIIFLMVMAILTLMPFVWVVSTSLRTSVESFTVPPKWIPVDMDFSNYTRVFTEIPFWRQIGNSFIITFSVVAGQLITASLAGYAFGRLRFPIPRRRSHNQREQSHPLRTHPRPHRRRER